MRARGTLAEGASPGRLWIGIRRAWRRQKGSQRIIPLVEIALVALLGLLGARLFWALLAPIPISATPPVPAATAPEAAPALHPFRRIAAPEGPSSSEETAAAETTLDLTLHGTWVEEDGGSAIIRTPDGKQARFRVGDTICCGARLEGVYADRITIARSGATESLRLPNKLQGAETPSAATLTAEESASASGESAPFSLRHAVQVRPVNAADGRVRFALFPAADESAFRRLGLVPGDILISINGVDAPWDTSRLAGMLIAAEAAGAVRMTVERDGAPVEISFGSGTAQGGK